MKNFISSFSVPIMPIPVPINLSVPFQQTSNMELKKETEVKKITKQVSNVISLDDDSESENSQEEEKGGNGLEEAKGGKEKQIRWKKKDDIVLFEELERHCRENRDTLRGIIGRIHDYGEIEGFWGNVSKKVGWVGTFAALSRRFLSL